MKKETPQTRYDRTHTKRLSFKFNLTHDADILQRFSEVENLQGYIKSLVREDIKKGSSANKC